MGGCLGSSRQRSSPVSIGKNHPLKPEKPKWKSDVALTDGQLRSKRDEFWDTAPVFEGRKEIWDALKAAAHALETGDHQMAQAIVDGANITLPNGTVLKILGQRGTLLDCYDELGTRYQLPVYVLSMPTNLVDEASSHTEAASEDMSPAHTGAELPLKFRFSHNNKDIKLTCRTTDSVLKVKRMIYELERVEPQRQRWCFGGRLISNKLKMEEAKIPKGCLVQVLVTIPAEQTQDSGGA